MRDCRFYDPTTIAQCSTCEHRDYNRCPLHAVGLGGVGKPPRDIFTRIMEEFSQHEREILDFKGGEYTDGKDRLMNFRQLGTMLKKRPSQICMYFMMKHVQSICQAVESGGIRWVWADGANEGLKQRIADMRNYGLLLATCLEEEQTNDGEQVQQG